MRDDGTYPGATSTHLRLHKETNILADVLRASITPTTGAGAVFGLAGAAFTIGNLLLAREMPVSEFGRFALEVALVNVFIYLAPLGLDQILLRYAVDPGPRLLVQVFVICTVIAAAAGIGAHWIYGLPLPETALLWIAIAAGAIVNIASAGLRAHRRTLAAIAAATGSNWIILAIGVRATFSPMPTAATPLTLYTAGSVVVAALAWAYFARKHRVPRYARQGIPRREAASLLGVAAAATVTLQLERLMLPHTLGIEALALFNVLASVAISPFRMAATAVVFALTSRIRALPSLELRRKLVFREARLLFLVLAAATVCTTAFAPMLTRWVTAGGYELGIVLVLAACLNGAFKVVQSGARAVVTGCGSARDMFLLNAYGWIAIAGAAAGALVGASGGLAELISGAALGSLAGTTPAALLAHRVLAGPDTASLPT